jgi:hypothetical protein
MCEEYERHILKLTEQHEHAINSLLDQFKAHLSRVQEAYEKSKKESEQLKMINEEKLTMTEADNKEEINKINAKQVEEKKSLLDVIDELKKDMQTLMWQRDRLQREKEMYLRKRQAEEQAA